MNNKSIWSSYKQKSITPPLNQNTYTDILIIGGGLTGISTAYHLINQNLRVTLVEKNEIGSGITSRTTGKLTYLQENIYSKLNLYHGLSKTKQYYNSQLEAINLVTNIIKKEKINCNLEEVKSYLFDINTKKLIKEYKILKKLNIPLKEDIINNNKAYYVDNTYVFHPLKYLYKLKEICLKNDINIYEHTKIENIEKENDYYICRTNNNFIKTKYIILASHYPYFLFPFPLPFKSYIEKSYIKAFQVDETKSLSAINITKPRVSLRYHQDNNINYELYLTNTHNLCYKHNERKNFEELLKKHSTSPNFVWSNTDIMTYDSLPFIGPINNDNKILLATGYNTWGMTNASLAGKILADYILNKENIYQKLFDPKRHFNIANLINMPNILLSNIYSFTKTKLKKQKNWYNNNPRFETRDNKSIAIYVDEENKEHIVFNKCPHLKCNLIFNENEKVWECPCHSSRFDLDGKVLDGPSNYDITYKK